LLSTKISAFTFEFVCNETSRATMIPFVGVCMLQPVQPVQPRTRNSRELLDFKGVTITCAKRSGCTSVAL